MAVRNAHRPVDNFSYFDKMMSFFENFIIYENQTFFTYFNGFEITTSVEKEHSNRG